MYVPPINVGPLYGSDLAAKLDVARQIGEVSGPSGSGFFFVPRRDVDFLYEMLNGTAQFFFDIGEEEKTKLSVSGCLDKNSNDTPRRNGYFIPKKGKEAVQAFCYTNPLFTSEHPKVKANVPFYETNIWPDEALHPNFRSLQETYYAKVTELCTALLRGYALALGKEEDFFEQYFKKEDTLSFVRLIHCPYMDKYQHAKAAPEDGTKVSVVNHVDPSLLTIIYQPDVANLQAVLDNGKFVDIPTSNDCFLVNAGGYMTHITNGYFKGPPHRVKFVNAETGRYAMPYFALLGYDTMIPPFVPFNPGTKSTNEPLAFGKYFEQAQDELTAHKQYKCNGQK